VAAGAAGASVVAVALLNRRTSDLKRLVEDLRRETVPLVRQARVVVEEAATEMVRVGDVLGSAESVSATVDSASRLTYRVFANPVVKVLAYSTGAGTALKRMFGRDKTTNPPRLTARPLDRDPVDGNGSLPTASAATGSGGHHRRRPVRR
jgi:hypothetical protein